MAKILNAEEGIHKIEKYSLKILNVKDEEEKEESFFSEKEVDKIPLSMQTEDISTFKEEFKELLSKSNDELSTKIVELGKKIESQKDEFQKHFKEVKDLAYKQGYNDGYNQAKKENEIEIQKRIGKLIESVAKVDEVYKEYQTKADNIEKELVGVAIDIAEQVIAKEVSKYSKQIALNLTEELLQDIKEATKIEIRVNPFDYEYLKEHLKVENVKITPDNAISPGGIVILSDAGNIEGEIAERFRTIKEHILKGR